MDELVLLTGGCCSKPDVQFDFFKNAISHFKCQSCGAPFREPEEGCGG